MLKTVMSVISEGDVVISSDGIKGKVIKAGPYGDEPFQILSDDGTHYGFIDDQGVSSYSDRTWKKNR